MLAEDTETRRARLSAIELRGGAGRKRGALGVVGLVNERWRRRLVGAWYLFHVSVYATITIAFYPHLVMMLAFLPLEEYVGRVRDRWR